MLVCHVHVLIFSPDGDELDFDSKCIERENLCAPDCFEPDTCPNGAHNESCLVLWPSRIKGLPPLSNLAKAPEGAGETNVFGHFSNYANAGDGLEGFLSVVVYGKKWVYCAREFCLLYIHVQVGASGRLSYLC